MSSALFRAAIFHTPSDPFKQNTSRALQAFADGGLVVRDGRVIAWMQHALFPPGHPYARPIGGSPTTLRTLTLVWPTHG